jgi:hypothetical protein
MKAAYPELRRAHMQKRARERFGLEIGKRDRHALVRKVQAGEIKFAHKLTNSRTVVVAEHAGVDVTFIYCRRNKGILTFLPPDARETAAWRASCSESQPGSLPGS